MPPSSVRRANPPSPARPPRRRPHRRAFRTPGGPSDRSRDRCRLEARYPGELDNVAGDERDLAQHTRERTCLRTATHPAEVAKARLPSAVDECLEPHRVLGSVE